MQSLRRVGQRWLALIEPPLLLVSAICVGYLLWTHFRAAGIQHEGAAALHQQRAAAVEPTTATPRSRSPQRVMEKNAVIAELEIPAVHISLPVLADDRSDSLLLGAGHIPGTALPGALGNVGIAGHRDTSFRSLRNIRVNTEIRLKNASGTYHYVVDSTEIVHPREVAVLDTHLRPELTLVTCYPFQYFGNAPLRFIVHAHLLSVLPDETAG